jgi:hypothetical protein
MRLRILLLAVPFVAFALTPARGDLLVDFGATGGTAPPPADRVADGWSDGNVANNPSSGSPSITYVNLTGLDTGGFGTATVEGVVTMAGGVNIPSNTFRAVNRATPTTKTAAQNPGLNNNVDNELLMRDWIGVTLLTTTVSGVITPGASPTLTLNVSGLLPGKYVWTSWHHDTEDQTGLIDYTFTDARGSTSGVIDISHGVNAASGSNTGLPANTVSGRGPAVNGNGDLMNVIPGMPTSFTHEFIVGPSGTFSFAMSSGFDVSLLDTMDNAPYSATSLNFALINGFQVARVPEPSTVGLFGSLALMATWMVKRRKK